MDSRLASGTAASTAPFFPFFAFAASTDEVSSDKPSEVNTFIVYYVCGTQYNMKTCVRCSVVPTQRLLSEVMQIGTTKCPNEGTI